LFARQAGIGKTFFMNLFSDRGIAIKRKNDFFMSSYLIANVSLAYQKI
jgi:hypothetical protein